jgi:hypothetical protein
MYFFITGNLATPVTSKSGKTGLLTANNNWNIITYSTVGRDTFAVSRNQTVNYLIVGGGGQGGYPGDRTGGGGGGGGVLYGTFYASVGTTYHITVGAGAPTMTSPNGVLGGYSNIYGSDLSAITAYPGGWGGTTGNNPPSYTDHVGSGGGSYHYNSRDSGGLGTSGQGNSGGGSYDSGSDIFTAGGGGGAGGVGFSGTSLGPGEGGAAVTITSTELPGYNGTIVVGGGGGGGSQTTSTTSFSAAEGGSASGTISGGRGSTANNNALTYYATNGLTYGGGGGGGSSDGRSTANGEDGYQGIVILTYLKYTSLPIITSNLIFSIKATNFSVPDRDYTNNYTITNNSNVVAVSDPDNLRGIVFKFNGSNYLSISAITPVTSTKTFWLYTGFLSVGQGNSVFSSKNYPVWFPDTKYLNWNASYDVQNTQEYMSTFSQSTTWTFYAITTTGTTSHMYINGVLNFGGSMSFEEDTSEIQFGAYIGANFYTGYIDDMRLYNIALNIDQIKAIYNGGF